MIKVTLKKGDHGHLPEEVGHDFQTINYTLDAPNGTLKLHYDNFTLTLYLIDIAEAIEYGVPLGPQGQLGNVDVLRLARKNGWWPPAKCADCGLEVACKQTLPIGWERFPIMCPNCCEKKGRTE